MKKMKIQLKRTDDDCKFCECHNIMGLESDGSIKAKYICAFHKENTKDLHVLIITDSFECPKGLYENFKIKKFNKLTS